MRIHVQRAQAPSFYSWLRCMTRISHSSTWAVPPKISTARSRIVPTCSAAARIAPSDSHELVAMQRPDSRSTSMDRPMHPSIRRSGQDLVADMGDTGVDGLPIRLDRGGTCVHGPTPFLI